MRLKKNGFEKIRWSICTDTPPPDTPTLLFLIFLSVGVIFYIFLKVFRKFCHVHTVNILDAL